MIVNRMEADNRQVVRLSGRFTFDCHREFRDAYKDALTNPAVRDIQIDLGEVDYIDSAALGMLLLLRESAQAAGKTVSLTKARNAVLAVLTIANFSKLFEID
jgi:anti-anti-sigma factor